MDAVQHVEEASHVWSITGAWIHNGELILQTEDTGDLVVIGRFIASKAVEVKRKRGRPRVRKNGLGQFPLSDSSADTRPDQAA